MKKLFFLFAFIAVASFTSCTDNDDELLIEQTQAIEKDKTDPRDNPEFDDDI